MAKKKSKTIVIYALVGLGVIFILWPTLKGFLGGSGTANGTKQPGWF